MEALPLSPPVFRILADLLEEEAGLGYRSDDAALLATKLSARALDLGFGSLLEYYYFLRYDEGGRSELDRLVEELVVHETYFFRERAPLQALVDRVLVPRTAQGPQRVWCAGVATGEEAYTLCMLLAERGILDLVSVTGTDVSAPALERARRGEYGERSLRAIPPGVLGRWLHRDGDRIVVDGALKARVSWQRVNLASTEQVRRMGPMDAILCRNVLIYFSERTTARAVDALLHCLKPDGYLLVGASESLFRFGTAVFSEELGGTFFYRRRVS